MRNDRRDRSHPWPCRTTSGPSCSHGSTTSVSSTTPPRRSTPRCWTRAPTSPRSARCTGSSPHRARAASRERRAQLRHPAYARPELLATAPNQLWSWDITKLKGPVKWTYYHLYVLLDVFSRYVVGWLLAHRESGTLADRLIAETVEKEGVTDGLMIHADRGPSMTSKTVALLFADLGIDESHSRPHVSNDDPFSEAQSRTLEYRPDFPSRFGSIEDGRAFCRSFFTWYDEVHCHGGIGLLTPEMVHRGRGEQVRAARQVVLTDAYAAHPERFVRKRPEPPKLPTAVWINPPKEVLPQ